MADAQLVGVPPVTGLYATLIPLVAAAIIPLAVPGDASTRMALATRAGCVERYPGARPIPGLVLYRFDAPLFFANVDHFRERVRSLARRGDVRWIVVAAEPITDVDATAGETLPVLNDELDTLGIELAFAGLRIQCATGYAGAASRTRSALIGSSPPGAGRWRATSPTPVPNGSIGDR